MREIEPLRGYIRALERSEGSLFLLTYFPVGSPVSALGSGITNWLLVGFSGGMVSYFRFYLRVQGCMCVGKMGHCGG